MGLYQRLSRDGLLPGRDIAVIGFRENPVCGYLMPSLSSFHVDLRTYGERLGEIMIAELDRGSNASSPAEAVHEVWPMVLVPGDSG